MNKRGSRSRVMMPVMRAWSVVVGLLVMISCHGVVIGLVVRLKSVAIVSWSVMSWGMMHGMMNWMSNGFMMRSMVIHVGVVIGHWVAIGRFVVVGRILGVSRVMIGGGMRSNIRMMRHVILGPGGLHLHHVMVGRHHLLHHHVLHLVWTWGHGGCHCLRYRSGSDYGSGSDRGVAGSVTHVLDKGMIGVVKRVVLTTAVSGDRHGHHRGQNADERELHG